MVHPHLASKMIAGWYCMECIDAESISVKKAASAQKWNNALPDKFRAADIKYLTDAELAPVIAWIKKPEGVLYVYGGTGCGKTYMAYVAKRYWYSNTNMDVPIYKANEMFINLRSSFGKKIMTLEKDVYDKYTPARRSIAIYDDLGVEGVHDYTAFAWYTIIERCYDNACPIMITSNLTIEEVAKTISDRVSSRILEHGTVVHYKHGDRRIEKYQERMAWLDN